MDQPASCPRGPGRRAGDVSAETGGVTGLTGVGRPPGGYGDEMESLPYWVFAGLAVISLVAAVVVGGEMWILPAVVLPVVLGYFAYDRRARRHESRDERLGAR